MKRANAAAKHIKSVLPLVAPIVEATGPVALPRGGETPLWVAVPKIIVGQMLSGHVADVIYARVQKAIEEQAVPYAWKLPVAQLRACGVSSRKIRTLQAFGSTYQSQPSIAVQWPQLPYDELRDQVGKIWGLGEWSASMLAIFHFGHEDVFPHSDGSLLRALRILSKFQNVPIDEFDTSKASPYRTYLALHLWKALDQGHLTAQSGIQFSAKHCNDLSRRSMSRPTPP
jgi:DNA-3-methyladenine glycosylase II